MGLREPELQESEESYYRKRVTRTQLSLACDTDTPTIRIWFSKNHAAGRKSVRWKFVIAE